eukprot:TRINITY_DN21106_c0_g1_i1.p1 TRINITY_DN21106_c0_g1~~TRINITY_DN21106_c0_g1_i1.p1  ORF type:complete len:384 (+),score=84.37 TRINITY_DN21106_c0_g1_i1:65-1153(+)
MFTILCCADMFGSKVNLELAFAAVPTIGELTRKIEDVFTAEMHALRPSGAQLPADGIRVSRLQVYDDVLLKWMDLRSSTQLHEYDQVYVFQPQTPWQVDTQQDLPPPRPPTVGMNVNAVHQPPAFEQSHQRGYSQSHQQPHGYYQQSHGPVGPVQAFGDERPNMAPEEKARAVFDEMDTSRRGFLEYADLERVFRDRGLDFSTNTIGELFYKADLNRDGRITIDEFINWSLIYPNTCDCLYFRGKVNDEEAAIQNQIQQAYDQVNQNQSREQQILREIEAIEAANRGLEEDISRCQQRVIEASNKKIVLDPEERELIEEEVKMERQHDQMRLSKARFQEASERFNRGAAAKGSPRRARDTPM